MIKVKCKDIPFDAGKYIIQKYDHKILSIFTNYNTINFLLEYYSSARDLCHQIGKHGKRKKILYKFNHTNFITDSGELFSIFNTDFASSTSEVGSIHKKEKGFYQCFCISKNQKYVAIVKKDNILYIYERNITCGNWLEKHIYHLAFFNKKVVDINFANEHKILIVDFGNSKKELELDEIMYERANFFMFQKYFIEKLGKDIYGEILNYLY